MSFELAVLDTYLCDSLGILMTRPLYPTKNKYIHLLQCELVYNIAAGYLIYMG